MIPDPDRPWSGPDGDGSPGQVPPGHGACPSVQHARARSVTVAAGSVVGASDSMRAVMVRCLAHRRIMENPDDGGAGGASLGDQG